MDRALVIGTRPGRLAVAQAHMVAATIQQAWPGIRCQIRTIATSGDLDQRTALWALRDRPGQQGFFTSQVEQALVCRQIDFAVHSLKDLPTRQADGLVVAAIMDRKYPEDCLVCNLAAKGLEDLPAGIKVGTSSPRRAAQVRAIRPDLRVWPLRGNVETRLAKLDTNQVDAIILARAGLERIGLSCRVTAVLDPRRFIPAPGQGALAVQVRAGDRSIVDLVARIDQQQVRALVEAERQVLVATGCGCHAPLGAFAEMIDGQFCIHAFIADPKGERLFRSQIQGDPQGYIALANLLGARLLDMLAAANG